MRIIFAGTPEFSAVILKALIDEGHDIVSAYTQPDRKTGRGQKVLPPAVKKCALKFEIPVKQPINFKTDESITELEALKPDLMIVVAYGLILPQSVLDIPTLGCLNIHASLLPKWRGAAPIQRAIEAQDKQTGICIMQMEIGLDTGPVLLQQNIDISDNDTSASLHDKLATLGAKTILDCLTNLDKYQKNALIQTHEDAIYAHKISKQDANIDWTNTAKEIDHQIRAFIPWPICQSHCKQQRLRIWQASISQESTSQNSNALPGEIISIDKTGIEIACGKGAIKLIKLQKDGSKPLEAADFINGSDLTIGDCFSQNT
jgi:methionyl-tRNA formyltransferase